MRPYEANTTSKNVSNFGSIPVFYELCRISDYGAGNNRTHFRASQYANFKRNKQIPLWLFSVFQRAKEPRGN